MEPIIKIENLYKKNPGSGKKELLLEDLNAEFEKGKVSLIIGENGSGKSTLINCISGLSGFEKGKITVAGESINYVLNEYSDPSRMIKNRFNLGIIFQQKALWEQYTVLDNVVQPLLHTNPRLKKKDAEQSAEELLIKLGIRTDLFKVYTAKISGGEQRKVAAARTLITDPEILIIDELEANLDLGALEDILRVLRDDYLKIGSEDQNIKKTLIIISHRIDLIELKFAPEIFLLKDGKLLIHAKNFAELQNAKKNAPEIAKFIKNVIDPARSQWYFGTSCLQTAKDISKLVIEDSKKKIGEGEMLQLVGKHLFDLITKLEPDEGHFLMIVTLEKSNNNEETVSRIRSVEMTKDIKELKLDGKDVNHLCKKIKVIRPMQNNNDVDVLLKDNYKDVIENDFCEFDDEKSAIQAAIAYSDDIFYQATKYHEKIPGCKKVQPQVDRNQSIELCKKTKTVYLVTIKEDQEVLGVISIDTTSGELWSNTVMEQFVLVANMAAIAIKQSKIEKVK